MSRNLPSSSTLAKDWGIALVAWLSAMLLSLAVMIAVNRLTSSRGVSTVSLVAPLLGGLVPSVALLLGSLAARRLGRRALSRLLIGGAAVHVAVLAALGLLALIALGDLARL